LVTEDPIVNSKASTAPVSSSILAVSVDSSNLIDSESDDIALFKSKSDDFMVQCYAIDKPLASEIAYRLPNPLFSFLHDYPLHQLNHINKKQIAFWNEQCKYILNHCPLYLKQMICNHFQNLFLGIAEHMNDSSLYQQRKFSRKEELCWKFWDLIGQYSKTHREVAFYAEKLHITPFYLAQISKDYLNDLPKDLINRQVILEIKALLQTTDKSIGEIAALLHFEDPSYMGRFFRRETGFSLTAYRKH